MLPKMHKKTSHIDPFVAVINHPTENISKYVDHHIHKYIVDLPSYVRDIQHFTKKLKELDKIPEGALPVIL